LRHPDKNIMGEGGKEGSVSRGGWGKGTTGIEELKK